MGVTAGFCAQKAQFIPLFLRVFTSGACRTAKSVMTKFGFIQSVKRRDLLEEGRNQMLVIHRSERVKI